MNGHTVAVEEQVVMMHIWLRSYDNFLLMNTKKSRRV